MPGRKQIRADFDGQSIVVYQAFNDEIADAALENQRFVRPFALNRMTWIKPSFLWMMERSAYGTLPDQERVLAVRITLDGWIEALRNASLSTRGASEAPVRVQWDPERDIKGNKLPNRCIQVGLGPEIVGRYVNEWTQEITDLTELVERLRTLREQRKYTEAQRLLPRERVWHPPADIAERLDMVTRV
ncbi:MAG TPA: DUF4291 domain-containing protein [Dehalococcoidia bacterium]|nr:DUF4291 domain-containing protein [Dehalococcoidia bacterium]